MKDIQFANHTLVLQPDGLLIWPDQKLAVVADLHLEKASYFALGGQFLPPHESYETLQNLAQSLAFSSAETVIFLGDSFHDEQGYERLDESSKTLFGDLCQKYKIIWVRGNHDKGLIPEGTQGVDEIKINTIMFRHIAEQQYHEPEISGHYHPKASLKLKGQKVVRPCFLQTSSRIAMPAYGTFTGGMNITNEVIQSIFTAPYCAHLLGQKHIYSIASESLQN